jgi:hypothetical protein
MTIEDTWATHEAKIVTIPNADDPFAVVDEARDAARAAMLAVLDELEGEMKSCERMTIEVSDHFIENAIAPLQARIEALGRGDA